MGHHRVNSFFLLRHHYNLSNTIWWRIHAGFVDGGGGLWIRLWYIVWDGLAQSVSYPSPPPPSLIHYDPPPVHAACRVDTWPDCPHCRPGPAEIMLSAPGRRSGIAATWWRHCFAVTMGTMGVAPLVIDIPLYIDIP